MEVDGLIFSIQLLENIKDLFAFRGIFRASDWL